MPVIIFAYFIMKAQKETKTPLGQKHKEPCTTKMNKGKLVRSDNQDLQRSISREKQISPGEKDQPRVNVLSQGDSDSFNDPILRAAQVGHWISAK
jgi:hypothetical protein